MRCNEGSESFAADKSDNLRLRGRDVAESAPRVFGWHGLRTRGGADCCATKEDCDGDERSCGKCAATLIAVAWKVAGALVLWLAGRWLIGLAVRMLSRALAGQRFDATLSRYLERGLSVLLNVVLIVAILGFFGVETTTFAALLAAGGVAIGVAWGGLLANFAAGAFLVFLRPFKVGDFVSAGGITGTVEAVGLFGTTINTPDNVVTIVGNNKVFSDTIQNSRQIRTAGSISPRQSTTQWITASPSGC